MLNPEARLSIQQTNKTKIFILFEVILPTPTLKGHKNMDKTNYAETTLGYNNRNKANFVSKWFFWYLNPTFTKGSKDRRRKWS